MAPDNENARPAEKNIADDNEKKLEEAKSDPSVREAAKKEKQPREPEDLSPIHDTEEVGTSGGDQRSKPADPAENVVKEGDGK